MNKALPGVIATLVTVIICGCPGLFGLFCGFMFTLVSFIPNAKIDIFGSHEPQSALIFGLVTLLISVILVAIPAVIGLITWRRNKTTTKAVFDKTIPPAI